MSNEVPYATTLHVRDHCLCFHTQAAARALSRQFDAAFRPLGISSWQFSLLISLNRPAPATIGQVAETLGMDRTTITANLKPLARRGFVVVMPDPEDRRSRRVALTETGMALLAKAAPIWEQRHAELETRLADGEPDQLRAALKALG